MSFSGLCTLKVSFKYNLYTLTVNKKERTGICKQVSRLKRDMYRPYASFVPNAVTLGRNLENLDIDPGL